MVTWDGLVMVMVKVMRCKEGGAAVAALRLLPRPGRDGTNSLPFGRQSGNGVIGTEENGTRIDTVCRMARHGTNSTAFMLFSRFCHTGDRPLRILNRTPVSLSMGHDLMEGAGD